MSRRNPEYGHGPPDYEAQASYEFYQDIDSGKWWISGPGWGDLVLGEQFRDLEEKIAATRKTAAEAMKLSTENSERLTEIERFPQFLKRLLKKFRR